VLAVRVDKKNVKVAIGEEKAMSTVTFGGWDAILERLLEVRPPGELGVGGLPGGSGGDAGLDSFGGGGRRRLAMIATGGDGSPISETAAARQHDPSAGDAVTTSPRRTVLRGRR
jgi:hypothetical protein